MRHHDELRVIGKVAKNPDEAIDVGLEGLLVEVARKTMDEV